jgi:branched-chain amino acid transport system substrate-binding protein
VNGRFIAAGLATTIVLAGCSRANPNADTASGPLRIGLLVSLSGTYKTVGEDMQHGLDLYLSTHGGKLGGHTVEVKVADEGEGSAAAVAQATKLIKEDKIHALVGIVGAGSVAAVVPLVGAARIPLVGANGRPSTTPPGPAAGSSASQTAAATPSAAVDGRLSPWVWHTSYISTEPGLAMGDYVSRNAGGPVYVIGPDYQGGWDEIGGFVDSFTKAGGQLANPSGKAQFTPFPGTTNFQPYLAQIQAAKPAAVYCFYAGGAAVAFVKQYKEFGLAGKIPLYAAGFLTEGSVLTAEGDAAAGIRNSLNYAADLDNPANRTFVGDYLKAYNTTPTTFAMATYDAAAVLDKAIAAASAAGPVNGQSINTAIAHIGQIDSPRGKWQFSPTTNTPVQRWYLREVRTDGKALANVIVQELITLGG